MYATLLAMKNVSPMGSPPASPEGVRAHTELARFDFMGAQGPARLLTNCDGTGARRAGGGIDVGALRAHADTHT